MEIRLATHHASWSEKGKGGPGSGVIPKWLGSEVERPKEFNDEGLSSITKTCSRSLFGKDDWLPATVPHSFTQDQFHSPHDLRTVSLSH